MMFNKKIAQLIVILLLTSCTTEETTPIGMTKDPPYVTSLNSHYIVDSDPTAFQNLQFNGIATRNMYDRRTSTFNDVANCYIFSVFFDDGLTTEFSVNPDVGSLDSAGVYVQKYAPYLGQIPTAFRTNLQQVWLQPGNYNAGGDSDGWILLHIDYVEEFIRTGQISEVLLHEGVHVSIEKDYINATAWHNAQRDDNAFITDYARENPDREDFAESFSLYIIYQYLPHRMEQEVLTNIETYMPHRSHFFEQNFENINLYPLVQ